jgi:thiamine biosynthesis protein ThiI
MILCKTRNARRNVRNGDILRSWMQAPRCAAVQLLLKARRACQRTIVAMKFIIKLFPEITIKSQSVRLRFIKILTGNIRNVLKNYDETLAVVRHWDHIEVRAKDENQRPVFAMR